MKPISTAIARINGDVGPIQCEYITMQQAYRV